MMACALCNERHISRLSLQYIVQSINVVLYDTYHAQNTNTQFSYIKCNIITSVTYIIIIARDGIVRFSFLFFFF